MRRTVFFRSGSGRNAEELVKRTGFFRSRSEGNTEEVVRRMSEVIKRVVARTSEKFSTRPQMTAHSFFIHYFETGDFGTCEFVLLNCSHTEVGSITS